VKDGFRSADDTAEEAEEDGPGEGDGGSDDDKEDGADGADEAGEKGGRSLTPVPAAPSVAWLVGCVSVFDRANQLFVAAIACRTAWRPLSSMPLPDPAASARLSPSESLAAGAASDAAGAVAPTEAEAGPAAEAFELFGLPMSSAGKGTGAWLTAPEDGAADEDGTGNGDDDAAEDEDNPEDGTEDRDGAVDEDGTEDGTADDDDGAADEDARDDDEDEDGAADEDEEPSLTVPSGTESAVLSLRSARSADREDPVPDREDPDRDVSDRDVPARDVPDRVRDEGMPPLSAIVPPASSPGSPSLPELAS
jgi:hypothetical protein